MPADATTAREAAAAAEREETDEKKARVSGGVTRDDVRFDRREKRETRSRGTTPGSRGSDVSLERLARPIYRDPETDVTRRSPVDATGDASVRAPSVGTSDVGVIRKSRRRTRESQRAAHRRARRALFGLISDEERGVFAS